MPDLAANKEEEDYESIFIKVVEGSCIVFSLCHGWSYIHALSCV